jgi:hypothetical protein
MPGIHKVELVGQEVVAAELGVTSQAISNWYARELDGMPVPVLIEFQPGKTPRKAWRRAQLGVWKKWHAKHIEEQGVHIPAKQRNKPAPKRVTRSATAQRKKASS